MTEIVAESLAEGRLRLQGELSFRTVPQVLAQGETLFEQVPSSVAIDLQGVSRSDSAGVALLVEWTRAAHRRHKNIVFRNVPPQMRSIVEVCGLEDILSLE